MRSIPVDVVGDLLFLFVHDLNNPLAALMSNLGFLRMDATTDDVREATADATLSCDSLRHLIGSLGHLAGVLGDQPPPSHTPCRALQVVQQAVLTCEGSAASHSVRVELAPDEGTNTTTVVSQAEALAHMLQCLLMNSIQHAPRGTTITVGITETPESVFVNIDDDGTPFTAENAVEAFTAQGQRKLKTNGRYSKGAGLFIASLCATRASAQLAAATSPQGTHRFIATLAR